MLCILFTAFISIFALDVFGEGHGVWQTALALLIHLIPTLVVLLVLVVSWRREWIGGMVYSVLAALYVVQMWGRFPLSVYFTIAGPLLLIGVLFFINWRRRAELRPGT